MKVFTYILSAIALVLIVFNLTKVDFNNLFSDESIVALITILAGLCTIVVLAILRISKKIEAKVKNKR